MRNDTYMQHRITDLYAYRNHTPKLSTFLFLQFCKNCTGEQNKKKGKTRDFPRYTRDE